jgi:ATP-binding protein involved in chromosome partitioning
MAHPANPLTSLPHDERIRSRKLAGGVATIIADASGLSKKEGEALERDLRSAALDIPGVSEARVAMTATQPSRTIVAIGSGKGGVGKSTVAANLAVAMARSGKKVGLVDADVYGPSQPTLLGSTSKPTAADEQLIPVEAHGSDPVARPSGVAGPRAAGDQWRPARRQVDGGGLGDAELLLVDMPPGTGTPAVADPAIAPGWCRDRFDPAGPVADDARRAVDLFNKMRCPCSASSRIWRPTPSALRRSPHPFELAV